MATAHVCNVDCRIVPIRDADGLTIGRAHEMFAAEPSSAAGRYQWEQNAALKLQGRRAWRASGQGQSRECRVWDERRRQGLTAAGWRHTRRFMASVGSQWSDEHMLRQYRQG